MCIFNLPAREKLFKLCAVAVPCGLCVHPARRVLIADCVCAPRIVRPVCVCVELCESFGREAPSEGERTKVFKHYFGPEVK